MESSQISSGNSNHTSATSESEAKLEKKSGGVWMHLALLFMLVILVKGLLIAFTAFLLGVNVSDSLQSNRVFGNNESREILQLRTVLQKLTAVLHNVTKDSKCQLCPNHWYWFWGNCYFFSVGLEKDRKWAESVDYCREHNASLVVIEEVIEMEFILGHMMTFPEMPFLWIGLSDSQEEGVWRWQDGTPLHNSIEMQWDSRERDCADLRGNGNAFAADCNVYGPWICEKPMEPAES
ncbi:CD209 antigen-like protein E [Hoplias malabaricus]|uniref:CD209 antigen-like protein E n=1 Tax=Hoplias malabaricus TaxID=27720 RepID=UPI0034629DFA